MRDAALPARRDRLVEVTLDTGTILRWNPDVQHEIDVAVYDLKEANLFRPQDLPAEAGAEPGPFVLHLAVLDNRLVMEIKAAEDGRPLDKVMLALTPLRRLIREYFTICESYYQAIRRATPMQIEAIDMGRRGLHDEAAVILRERLDGKVEIDHGTARRLFTLICVLHIRG